MSSTSRSAIGSRSAARRVLELSAIGSTAAIDRIDDSENPKSIRTGATPIDRRNSHGESPSSRAVLVETSATTVNPDAAAADTIDVAVARSPAGESSVMCNDVNASVAPANAADEKVDGGSDACAR